MYDLSNHIVIYHGGCDDGFGAAWVFWDNSHLAATTNLEFFAGKHGEEPPYALCKGRHVIMVDFSYKRDKIEELQRFAKTIIILDHHKSAELELKGLPNIPKDWDPEKYYDTEGFHPTYARFDMHKSGAMLAWEFVNPNVDPFALILRIEDNDLWRTPRRYEDSVIIQAALRSYPQDFRMWDVFMSEDGFEKLSQEGIAIRRYIEQKCAEIVQHAYLVALTGEIIPIVNCPYAWASEVAGALAENHEVGIGCAFFIRADRKVQFSLRSRGSANVREIAQKFSGGGHDKAAGFELSVEDAYRLSLL